MKSIFDRNYFTKEYYYKRKRSNYSNYSRFDNNAFWRPVIKVIKKYKMSGNFLDLGCAFGFLSKRVIPYFTNVYGLDISEYAISRAQNQTDSVRFVSADLNKKTLPYNDNYFNCVAALDIIEHTESTENTLKIITKKLAPNGYLIIGFPVRDTVMGKIVGIFDKDPTHISIVNRKTLKEQILKAGLSVVEQHYFTKVLGVHVRGLSGNIFIVARKQK
ncbi:MAG: class I SAM-dependent methyltransferase [Candidatus Paceibacterota bacterium]